MGWAGRARCGGIEHFANKDGSTVQPDILVTGKGRSGGVYPIAATSYRPELNSFPHANPSIHISTFGGAEVDCAVALAVLEISGSPAFLKRVGELAGRFATAFQELQAWYPEALLGTRQLGLMIGLVFPDEICGPLMTKLLYEEGVLAIYANNDRQVVQFLPPLIMSDIEAQETLGALDRALRALSMARGWTVRH